MLWIYYLPAYLFIWLLKYPAAIIAILFFSSPDRLALTRWHWLETIDNTLAGDYGWQTEHITGDPLSNWNRINWLWRNGGNWFNYWEIGCAYKAVPRNDEYWFSMKVFSIFGAQFELITGWNISGPQSMRCKYVITVRRHHV